MQVQRSVHKINYRILKGSSITKTTEQYRCYSLNDYHQLHISYYSMISYYLPSLANQRKTRNIIATEISKKKNRGRNL